MCGARGFRKHQQAASRCDVISDVSTAVMSEYKADAMRRGAGLEGR